MTVICAHLAGMPIEECALALLVGGGLAALRATLTLRTRERNSS